MFLNLMIPNRLIRFSDIRMFLNLMIVCVIIRFRNIRMSLNIMIPRGIIGFRNIRMSLNLINLFGIMRFRNITLSCRRVSRYTGTSTVEGCWPTHVDTHQHEIILQACTSCKRDECFHMRPHWVSHRFEVDDPRAVPFQRHSAREVAVSVG